VTERLDAILAALDAYGPGLPVIPHTDAMQKVHAALKALQELPSASDALLAANLITMLPVDLRSSVRMPRMIISGTVVVTPPPPYPADLVQTPQQQDAAKTSHAQFMTLVKVLIWLLLIIVPVVEQRLGAEARSVTDAEVGTVSLALAITVLMKARK
jgi:hypothetical protein